MGTLGSWRQPQRAPPARMRDACAPRCAGRRRRLAAVVCAAACAALCPGAGAQSLRFHSVFNDGMVLQRGAACVYGGGALGAGGVSGTVELRWSGAGAVPADSVGGDHGGSARAPATPDGAWRVCLPDLTQEYSGPRELSVRLLTPEAASTSTAAPAPLLPAAPLAPDELRLRDVLIGEVWLASGQSNMGLTTATARIPHARHPQLLSHCVSRRAHAAQAWDWEAECAAADGLAATSLRFMTTPGGTHVSNETQAEFAGRAEWRAPSAAVACSTSAVGYFFARALAAARPHAPVGVVVAAVDGTNTAAWTPAEAAASCGGECNGNVAGFWNGRVAPLRGFPLRGVLWWQGESDTSCSNFGCRTRALVDAWRAQLSAAASGALLPFFMVQLAPYVVPFRDQSCGADGGAWIGGNSVVATARLTQAALAAAMPGVHLVCAIDLGDAGSPFWPGSIHTRHKRPVGERLAALARKHAYGESELPTRGPRLRGVTQLPPSEARKQLLTAFRLRFRLAHGAAPLRVHAALAPSAPGGQFAVWLANRTRVSVSVLPGSVEPDSFDVGVAWWGADADQHVTRLDAYMSDFPLAQVWDANGLPMEPWSVYLQPYAGELWGWGETLPAPPSPPPSPPPPPPPAPPPPLDAQSAPR